MVRGDCNGDGSFNVGDAIFLLGILFGEIQSSCDDACDANDDGLKNIADTIYILTYLFSMGADLPPPSSDCGTDPTNDGLDCAEFTSCP